MRFGYPVKLRTPDFYGPDRSEQELHLREDSFVNDSIRAAHQYRRSSIIPHYEALDDPHLRQFFHSPVVLDVVRKTLNVDSTQSFKHDDRSSKMSMTKLRSRSVRILRIDFLIPSHFFIVPRMISMTIMLTIIVALSPKVHPVMRNSMDTIVYLSMLLLVMSITRIREY